MPEHGYTVLNIFLSCPGDIEDEVEQIKQTIEELNRGIAGKKQIVLQLKYWKTHTRPDAGRPQEVIGQQIGQYDIYVGLMWKRFGTPTGKAGSGTEEEFNDALESYKQTGKPKIKLYFNQAPSAPTTTEEVEQWKKVLQFREKIHEQQEALSWNYPNPDAFKDIFREHLTQFLLNDLSDLDIFSTSISSDTPTGSSMAKSSVQDTIEVQQVNDKNELLQFMINLEWATDSGVIRRHAASYYNFAQFYMKEKEYDRAVKAYDKAIEIGMTQDVALYNNKGNALINLSRLEEALDSYNKAIGLSPDDPFPYNGRGNVLLELERYEEALESYEKAISLKQDYVHPWCGKGHALRHLGRLDEAMKSYDTALQIDGSEAVAFIGKGNVYLSLGEYQKAIEYYEMVREDSEPFAEALNSKGVALARLGRIEESLEFFVRSSSITPKALYLRNQANTLYELGKDEESIEIYNKIIRQGSKNVSIYGLKSNPLVRLGRFNEALETIEQVIKLSPYEIEGYTCRGNILGKLGRYDEALADCNKAYSMNPDLVSVINGKAWIHILRREYDEAIIVLEKGLERISNDPSLLSNKGLALAGLRRFDEAVEFHNQAIANATENAIHYSERAWTFSEMNEFQKCLDDIGQAITLKPKVVTEIKNNAGFRNIRGDLQFGPKFRKLIGEE